MDEHAASGAAPAGGGPSIREVAASAYVVPTEEPESDGTLEWSSTTLVLVELEAGGERGLGYSYTHEAAAVLISDLLAGVVTGRDAFDVAGGWNAMLRAVRNVGRPGLVASAIAAVDNALWDLKARLLGLPLVELLGQVRDEAPAYASGGFTSQAEPRLREQLGGWADAGFTRVKMKVGRRPEEDVRRVRIAREAVGEDVRLYVDANGAYERKQALAFAKEFAELGVSYFEEPVTSDDLVGLRLLRDRAPPGMEIAAGEYGYDGFHFRRMLEAGAVDVLQADATRCLGITGFLQAAALCDAWSIPLSAHTAPSLHAHPCCALGAAREVEYFHDHARLEGMLFDGAARPDAGRLRPDLSRPGLGLELRRADAEPYRTR